MILLLLERKKHARPRDLLADSSSFFGLSGEACDRYRPAASLVLGPRAAPTLWQVEGEDLIETNQKLGVWTIEIDEHLP